MKKRDHRMFLEDILDSINQIESYISGMSYYDFSFDRKTIDSVIRNLEIIGEASKNIPLPVREKYPDIPWKRMIGLRNIAIHAYFGIDLENIWKIISSDIPPLNKKIKKILQSLPDEF
jgi:uncharacterized protein with HEPN domain